MGWTRRSLRFTVPTHIHAACFGPIVIGLLSIPIFHLLPTHPNFGCQEHPSSSPWSVSIILEEDKQLDHDGEEVEKALYVGMEPSRMHRPAQHCPVRFDFTVHIHICSPHFGLCLSSGLFHAVPVIPVRRRRLDTRSQYFDGLGHYCHC